jgi:hypothetical protein
MADWLLVVGRFAALLVLLGEEEGVIIWVTTRWGTEWVANVLAYPHVRRLTQTAKIGRENASVWVTALEMPLEHASAYTIT